MFVKYLYGKKGWKLYDLETNEYFISRDVVFYETEIPFTQEVSKPEDSPMINVFHERVDDENLEVWNLSDNITD